MTIYCIIAATFLLALVPLFLGVWAVLSILRFAARTMCEIWRWYYSPAMKVGGTPFREATVSPPPKGTPWYLFRRLAWLLILGIGCTAGYRWYTDQPSADVPIQVREPPSRPIVREWRCHIEYPVPVIVPEPRHDTHPTMLRRIPRCVDDHLCPR